MKDIRWPQSEMAIGDEWSKEKIEKDRALEERLHRADSGSHDTPRARELNDLHDLYQLEKWFCQCTAPELSNGVANRLSKSSSGGRTRWRAVEQTTQLSDLQRG